MVKKIQGWRWDMWRLAAHYRSPGYYGNLASLQRQWVACDPRGSIYNTHTHARAVASCSTHSSLPGMCSCMTRSHKCGVNLTSVTLFYGNPNASHLPSSCNQNVHIGASLGNLGSFPYVNEESFCVRRHCSSHSIRSNNIILNVLVLIDLHTSAIQAIALHKRLQDCSSALS